MDELPNGCDQKVSVLPTDDLVVVSPFTPLSQAIEAMKNDEGGCVIVSDDGRVAGIFTERDLLTKVLGENVDLNSPIKDWIAASNCSLRKLTFLHGPSGVPSRSSVLVKNPKRIAVR